MQMALELSERTMGSYASLKYKVLVKEKELEWPVWADSEWASEPEIEAWTWYRFYVMTVTENLMFLWI